MTAGPTGGSATDPGLATRVLQLTQGPHVAAATVEARQRVADGSGIGSQNADSLFEAAAPMLVRFRSEQSVGCPAPSSMRRYPVEMAVTFHLRPIHLGSLPRWLPFGDSFVEEAKGSKHG